MERADALRSNHPTGPTYRELADDLVHRVETGEYSPGSPLPSYASMARHYQVSVSTVQRALMLLRDRGIVVGRQGRGVFVAGGQGVRHDRSAWLDDRGPARVV